MRTVDLGIIVVYLLAMPIIGMLVGRKQRSAKDYFVGESSLPWWAVCFSVVATETSTLTVISTPGLVFGNALLFLQLALGYIVGRIIAAFVLLPQYFKGNLVSAYEFLGKRFGGALQGVASITFVITRLLAEGVRLFAGAIPIKVILDHYGLHTQYWQIVLILTVLTLAYAYVGGIRAVVWVDVIQLSIYLLGAVAAVVVLASSLPDGWASTAAEGGRFELFNFTNSIVTSPYMFVTAVVGGAVLSMASHGADQLIAQRLLATRSLRDGQKALIGSGLVVFVQFSLFLLVGVMLWVYNGGKSVAELGMQSADDVFPTFIVDDLPVGLSGLLIAGVLASTMGALASALNALSTSTVADLYQRFTKRALPDASVLRHGRIWTLIWAGVFVVFASMFSSTKNSVIELGLGITGYTYGALLGAFLLGLLVRRARQLDAIIAFVVTVVVMATVILGVTFTGPNGKELPLAYPWYTPLGVVVTLVVGGLLALRHRNPPEPEVEQAVEATAA
ncbi:sodium:solute symporter [Goodfellowiella coeruleoviolacea]|uniref:Transporter, SSS family n=1 Tax=Goodfellowiella coeruleoviolacea TaxID=334858 RepID=A0AAE3GLB3_9PSEU|nr:sodium:solute symporter [Goodfellowiella coeruleoviolacea]MCP2170306.1 transporter, SSS family [Goodfellowiella coeruleoviolacea]